MTAFEFGEPECSEKDKREQQQEQRGNERAQSAAGAALFLLRLNAVRL